LARPLDLGSHLAVANWARLLVFLGILGAAAFLLRKASRRTSGWLFLALFPLTVVMPREFDYELVGLIMLLCTAAVTEGLGWLFLPSALLAGLVPWIKFGTGLCAAGTVGVSLVVWLVVRRRWREVVLAAGAYLLTFGMLARALVGTWAGLRAFLRTSWEIARGYNASMATIGPTESLIAAAVVLFLIAGVGAWRIRTRPQEAIPLAISSVSILYASKHAFVRQDSGHAAVFFAVVFWCVLVWLLFADDRRARRAWVMVLVVPLLSVAITPSKPSLKERFQELGELITGERGSGNLYALLHPAEVRESLRWQARGNLVTDVLPAEWLKTIGQESVVVFPWEISLCLANQLRCVPYPTLQMYSTYTPMLDRWSARRLREVAPRFAIASLAS